MDGLPPGSRVLIRALTALALAGAALAVLSLATPLVLMRIPRAVGPPATMWTTDNAFQLAPGENEIRLQVDHPERHARLRARFSVCPREGLEGCRAGEWRSYPWPAGGTLELRFAEHAGTIQAELQRAPFHPLYLAFLALLGGAVMIGLRGVCRWVSLALLASSGLYFSVTLAKVRGLDFFGHLAHVQGIAIEGPLVNANNCWECFQPPAYYLLAAALLGRPTALGPGAAAVLQGLSLLLHLASVPLVVAALRPFAHRTRDLALATAMVCLWPAAVLESVRVGNDALLSLVAFACLAALLRGRLVVAAALAGGALLVKANGVLLVALCAGVIVVRYARRRLAARPAAAAALPLLLGIWAAAAVAELKHVDPRRLEDLAPRLRLQNTATNVLLPDPLAFVREGFVNPWVPTPSRDRLVNYFWKSALFGEWGYDYPGAALLAQALSLALLVVLGLLLAAGLQARSAVRLPAFCLALSLLAVAGYRLRYPFACNADFRFVTPVATLALALVLLAARGPVRRALWIAVPAVLGGFQVLVGILWFFERG